MLFEATQTALPYFSAFKHHAELAAGKLSRVH